ncbi:unnamed protein product [Ilex paraguariensis]|uniref:Uncharacterized protein n=1 Tax=Ilex paraguariensis TaxID=185542 RepID=A0ABC8T534_9AQUA
MAPPTRPPRHVLGKQPLPPPPLLSGGAGQEGRWRIRKTPPAMQEEPAETDGQRLKRIVINREPTIEAKEEKRCVSVRA